MSYRLHIFSICPLRSLAISFKIQKYSLQLGATMNQFYCNSPWWKMLTLRKFRNIVISFAHINPSISACKGRLLALATKKVPIKKLQKDLPEGGSLAIPDINYSSRDIEYLESLLEKYVDN